VVLYHDPFNDPFYWRSVVYVPAALLALSDIRGTRYGQPGMIPASLTQVR
jgi:hypothetical protein